MKTMLALVCVAAAAVLWSANPVAQESKAATVSRADGGSMVTPLSSGIAVNKGSTLHREWSALHDPRLPVDLVGTPGISTKYIPSQYSGEYRMLSKVELDAKEPLAAIEVKLLTFDVWGGHMRSLSTTEVTDYSTGKFTINPEWRLDEHDCTELYASVAYVARVRTKAGKVFEADTAPVLEEARRISSKFTAEDLEETKEK